MRSVIFLAALVLLAQAMLPSPANAQQDAGDDAARPQIVAWTQVQYTLHNHYLHDFKDRPLFHDPSTFFPEKKRYTSASYAKNLEIMSRSGIDAIADFIRAPNGMYRMALWDIHDDVDPDNLAKWAGFGDANPPGGIEIYDQLLERALASPHAARHDGRVLITSYHAWKSTPEEWASTLNALRGRHGDTFLFSADIYDVMRPINRLYRRGNGDQVTSEMIAEAQDKLRAYLDVVDGVHFWSTATLWRHDPQRIKRFDAELYERLIALTKEVLNEPPYRDKLFSIFARLGHHNENLGHLTMNENGTRTLRRSMELAIAADPDFIHLPEWNESRENTSFQPTVFNSRSTQRILRYYASQLRGESPAPIPGDDQRIPNLILSYRKAIKAGELLEFELLNVPDTTDSGSYQVALKLKSIDGQTVHAFSPAAMPAHELHEIRVDIPAEDLIQHDVLRPSLTVQMPDGERMVFEDGLRHVRLRPTWSDDYKWVKQPLRDVLQPTVANVSAHAEPPGDVPVPDFSAGKVTVQGEIAVDEPLASVEILSDDSEVYAVNTRDAYGLDDPDSMLFRVKIHTMYSPSSGRLPEGGVTGAIRVHGVDTFEVLPSGSPYWAARKQIYRVDEEDSTIAIDVGADVPYDLFNGTPFFVRIPVADLETAELDIDLNVLEDTVSLSTVAERGLHARTVGDGLLVGVERYTRLPRHPFHIDDEQATFEAEVYPDNTDSVLFVRAITKSGRIYRSEPIAPLAEAPGETVDLPVFSRADWTVKHTRVRAHRIPNLEYNFDPSHHAVLTTDAGRRFYAVLGAGSTQLTTGIGGGKQGSYGAIVREWSRRQNYPLEVERSAPQWTQEDSADVLHFDGIANVIGFQKEALPRGAFNLSFEIKPTARKAHTLFIRHGYYEGFFHLGVDEEGNLIGQFRAESLQGATVAFDFESDLQVPINQWSRIEVSYDMDTITLKLNDQSERFSPPEKLPHHLFNQAAFGGFGDGDGYFEGYLRALRIRHRP